MTTDHPSAPRDAPETAVGTSVNVLPTPCLVVDEDRMRANMDRAQAYADAQEVRLRPHAKTHKSPALAREQVARGAVGICVAKLGEAEVMADGGVHDVVMAHTPYGPDNARRAARLARRIAFVVGVDHRRQVEDLSAAAEAEGATVAVRVEVDTGAGRGGLAPADVPGFLSWARERPGLHLQGLYTYEGYTYDAPDTKALFERHREAQHRMVELAGRTTGAFTQPPVVSMGSTPSQTAGVPLLDGITEIRPGTSIFHDAAQAWLAGGLDRCAAFVVATVVSRTGDRAILDAGSKSLTTDARPAGVCATRGYGRIAGTDVVLTRLSEEHGVVEGPDAEALAVGDRVAIVPNHICPVVNLFDHLTLARNGRVTRVLPVASRGRTA
ncbi:MAG: alanine racemase [Trueperaceae bacterium]|nr:alanine racemase [Trueperaceae bacterium]